MERIVVVNQRSIVWGVFWGLTIFSLFWGIVVPACIVGAVLLWGSPGALDRALQRSAPSDARTSVGVADDLDLPADVRQWLNELTTQEASESSDSSRAK